MRQVSVFIPHSNLGALPSVQSVQKPIFSRSTAAVASPQHALRAGAIDQKVGDTTGGGVGLADRIVNLGPVGILGVVTAAAVVGYLVMRK